MPTPSDSRPPPKPQPSARRARKEPERPLAAPVDVAAGPDGALVVADRDRSRIVRVDRSGQVKPIVRKIQTFAYDGYSAYGVAVDGEGNVLYADARHQCVRRIGPDGTEDHRAGRDGLTTGDVRVPGAGDRALSRPVAIAVDGDAVLVCTLGDDRVWRVSAAGDHAVVAGAGGRGTAPDGTLAIEARLSAPRGVTVDARGRVVFSERWSHVVRVVEQDGTLATLARGLAGPTGVVADADDDAIYVADTGNGRVCRIDARGALTTVADGLVAPTGLALDADRALYVTDAGDGSLWRRDPGGAMTRLVGAAPDAR